MLEHLFFMLFALGTFAIGVYVIRNNVKFFNMFKISQKNNYRPSVSVIAPVRDTDEKFEENILSLLKQKYKGKWEVLFVVDEDDRKTRDSVNKIIRELADIACKPAKKRAHRRHDWLQVLCPFRVLRAVCMECNRIHINAQACVYMGRFVCN